MPLQGAPIWAGINGHSSSLAEMWVDHATNQLFTGGTGDAVCVWPLNGGSSNGSSGASSDAPNADGTVDGAVIANTGPVTYKYNGTAHRKGDNVLLARYHGAITYHPDGTFTSNYVRLNARFQKQAYVAWWWLRAAAGSSLVVALCSTSDVTMTGS